MKLNEIVNIKHKPSTVSTQEMLTPIWKHHYSTKEGKWEENVGARKGPLLLRMAHTYLQPSVVTFTTHRGLQGQETTCPGTAAHPAPPGFVRDPHLPDLASDQQGEFLSYCPWSQRTTGDHSALTVLDLQDLVALEPSQGII